MDASQTSINTSGANVSRASGGPMTIAQIVGVSNPQPIPSSDPAVANLPPNFERYEKIEKLGEGTYGVVYKARDRLKNRLVALKKVRMDAWEDGVPATALREISVLKEVRHAHVVGLDDVFVSFTGNLYLVFELLDRDLKQCLDAGFRDVGMEPALVKALMFQLLRGTEACHVNRIVHRDIKPQNVLINADGTLKLADFGLARTYALPLRQYTHEVVTLWYRCPEILLGSPLYSTAVDLWSAGCIFAEMASGRPLFTGESEIDQLLRVFEKLGTPNTAQWPKLGEMPDWCPLFPKFPGRPWHLIAPRLCAEGRDLLSQMLAYDPVRRISAADALAHPYFKDVRFPVPLPPPPPPPPQHHHAHQHHQQGPQGQHPQGVHRPQPRPAGQEYQLQQQQQQQQQFHGQFGVDGAGNHR